MNRQRGQRGHRAGRAVLIGSVLLLAAACAVTDGGAGYRSDVRIGVDYYEPWYGDYGGWGPGYRVAPFPRGVHRPDFGRGHPPPRVYRPAPRSRPYPSIPSRPHPGRPSR